MFVARMTRATDGSYAVIRGQKVGVRDLMRRCTITDSTMDWINTWIQEQRNSARQRGVSLSKGLRVDALSQAHVGQRSIVALLVVLIVFLLFVRIGSYPSMSPDEGRHVLVPKTLSTDGRYAYKSADGYRYHGPVVAVGPTLHIPIAMAFEIGGIGITQARLVIALYILAATVLYFRVGRTLFSQKTAIAGTFLLLIAPGYVLANWDEGGVIVVGEVPALAFLLAGHLMLWKAIDNPGIRSWFIVGVFWALAFMTKNQFAMIVAPTMAMLGLAARWYYKAARVRDVWIPLAIACSVYLAWIGAQFFLIDGSEATTSADLTRSGSILNFVTFSAEASMSKLRFLMNTSVLGGFLLPGAAFAAIASLERSVRGFQRATIGALILAWLFWYVTAAMPWPRYAYPALALSCVFLAELFSQLTDGFLHPTRTRIKRWMSGQDLQSAARVAFTILFLATIARPLQLEIRRTLTHDDTSQTAFAAYLNEHVDRNAVIDTGETPLMFLTDHTFHDTPPEVEQISWKYNYFGTGFPPHHYYKPTDVGATYVITGPNSKAVGNLYSEDHLAMCWRLVHSVGMYDLYRIRPQGATERACSG